MIWILFRKHLRTAISLVLTFTVITGFLYPSLIYVLSQTLFSTKANGSLITHNNIVVGSELIGQEFKDPKYFWSRPSSTPDKPYNARNSQASNLALSNPKLIELIKSHTEVLRKTSHIDNVYIPIDLVTSSASGLDPETSLQAVIFQVPRVAHERKIKETDLIRLIEDNITHPTFGIFGPYRVNVLKLNLALEAAHEQ